ncbi:DNA repair protein RecO [Bacteroidales bacterium OttesenSCG-928-K03]|nr:DNA repair protein RecO [Odoribacter sp. OttesenSCG-928-L07]MDL2239000.1 DNA repair protein RecO [Bacteroidales bacterium OttesenSCG-928-L14]MDL2240712.1 DNA repair protein RecO [Bacteroidales bacterium OttesenSCG-928-K22]MDL2242162.1 DNA repair protein RecO [Bacteroidales bacterium OttesenSCG-928-K03]
MATDPYIKTQGIVLRTIPYSETSCITNVFTRDHGIVPCLIKGIRKKTAKHKLAHFKELSIINLEIKKYKNSNLYYVVDVSINYLYAFFMCFHQDINKGCIFMFVNELINKCIRDEVNSKELYDFVYNALMELDQCKKVSFSFHVVFMVQFAEFFGFALNFDNYTEKSVFNISEGILTEEIPENNLYIPSQYVELIHKALNSKLNDPIPGCNTAEIRKNIVDYLQLFYQYHFPKFEDIKSTAVLKQILRA